MAPVTIGVGVRIGRSRRQTKTVQPDPINTFKTAVLADGGTFDEALFRAEFDKLHPLIKREAVGLIVPGAYKAGFIYAMNCRTGELVKCPFGRASIGTYFDQEGNLQTAPVNVPRVDWLKNFAAYSLESSRVNVDKNSNVFLSRPAIPFTPNYQSYKGVAYGRFTDATVGSHLKDPSTAVGAGALTISYFLKDIATNYNKRLIFLGTPGGNKTISIYTDTLTVSSSAEYDVVLDKIDLGDGFCRISITVKNFDGASEVYPLYGQGEFLVAEVQVEQGQLPTSLIQTSGSQVTRAKDNLTVPDLIGVEGSVFMDFEVPDLTGLTASFLQRDAANENGVFLDRSASDPTSTLSMNDGVTVLNNDDATVPGSNKIVSSIKDSGNKKLAVNGTVSQNGLNGDMNDGQLFSVGSANPGQIHLRSLAFFDRQLTDAEHIELTQP